MKNKVIKWAVLLLVVAPIVGISLWTWGSLTYVYSKGERAGYLQKFSKKGWMFKTWEGELAMMNLPGTTPEIFRFTVRDDAAAQKIKAALGTRVVLRYDEHRGIPSKVFGDTSYFATSADPVGGTATVYPPVQ